MDQIANAIGESVRDNKIVTLDWTQVLEDALRMPRKRKPGRPRGTTRGGSHVIHFRVNDAQHAELETEGPSANLAAKRRAFPLPSAPPKETT